MSLSAKDLSILSRWLDEALELPATEVERWLSGLPAAEGHLLPRLRQLLAEHISAEPSAFMARGPVLDDNANGSVARADERVGPFRLIREIGRGGMGAVWLAEKADGSLRREIALKLPRLAWGAGLAERMARERDIGALLTHPNIARLYDAGVDELGRPYLALEYIDGVPIDAWCRSQALSIPERLRLFLQVVRAVAYAHGRLVVHRDLKPSNVLVSADGQAHLLDFGIAKLLHDAAADEAGLTEEQGRVYTPHYASPEQILGEVVTVAADVYSLGVLLFELLTEQRPYGSHKSSRVALETAILQGEAPLASTRASQHRARRVLQGELDAIVGQALKRMPQQRYATADALAQDIERHLKGDRVLARADSMAYRIGKVLKRHRSAFAATAAVMVAVLGAAGFSLVQAKRAGDAAERARVVKEFVVDVFKVNERGSTGNDDLRRLPAELLLERGAKLIETKFPGQPRLQAELFGVVGGIFADMGANAQAANYATHQVETLVAIDGGQEEQARATLLLAQSLFALGRTADARVRVERAVILSADNLELRSTALVLLARTLRRQGDLEGVKAALARADEDFARLGRPTAASARAANIRAGFLLADNRFDEAIPVFEGAIATALAAEGPLSQTAIDIRLVLAWNFMSHDRPDDAKPHRDQALAALRSLGVAGQIRAAVSESEATARMFSSMIPRQISFGDALAAIERNRSVLESHGPLVPAVIRARVDSDLSNVLRVWGDVAKAAALEDRSYPVLVREAESLFDQWDLAGTHGFIALLLGRHKEAEESLARFIDLRKRQGDGRHPWAAYDYVWAARNLAMRGDFERSEALLASAPRFDADLRGGGASSGGHEAVIQKTLAAIKLERGDAVAAYALFPFDRPDTANSLPFDETHLRGAILCAVGRRVEGLELLEKSLAESEPQFFANHPALARNRAVTGLCALATGKRLRAVDLAEQAAAAFQAQPDVSDYFKGPLTELRTKLSVSSK